LLSSGERAPKHDLAAVADRYLARTLDKVEQAGDWTGPLTTSQIAYAAADAAVLVPLAEALEAQIGAAGLARGAGLESRVVPAVVRMAAKGVAFDREKWTLQAAEARANMLRIQERLNRLAPGDPALFGNTERNWNSPDEVKAAFAAVGINLDSTDDS